jgi:hypothetical protein
MRSLNLQRLDFRGRGERNLGENYKIVFIICVEKKGRDVEYSPKKMQRKTTSAPANKSVKKYYDILKWKFVSVYSKMQTLGMIYLREMAREKQCKLSPEMNINSINPSTQLTKL